MSEIPFDPKDLEIPSPENEDLVSSGEKEVILDNGERLNLPTLEVERMTLFHGSATAGIQNLEAADETTVGNGVYLTSDPKAAAGYAAIRSKGEIPSVYETEISNLTLLDLRENSGIESFSQYFLQELLKWR